MMIINIPMIYPLKMESFALIVLQQMRQVIFWRVDTKYGGRANATIANVEEQQADQFG